MKPACAAPILVLAALSSCSREAETSEALAALHQEIGAEDDPDALPAEDTKPGENDSAMQSPVEFD